MTSKARKETMKKIDLIFNPNLITSVEITDQF